MAARRIATPLIILCALVLTVSANAAPPTPIVSNGDFEAATLGPWISSGTVTLADAGDWAAASGAQSVELVEGGAVYQDAATTAQRYNLSFSYAANPSLGCLPVKTLDVSWFGGSAPIASFRADATGHTTSSMGWQTAHVLVDTPAAPTQVRFADYGDAGCGGVVVDDVAMTAPSSGQTGTQLTAGDLVFGQTLQLAATVIGASADVTPTGSVQFIVDGSAEGGPVTLSTGQAQTTVDGLAIGNHTVEAAYTPSSASFQPSSVMRHVRMDRGQTGTSIGIDPQIAPLGQEVTVTATVYPYSPANGARTGTVQFADELGPLGDPVTIDESGVAQISLTEDVGDHELSASYSGDANFEPSAGYGYLTVTDPGDTTPPPAGGDAVATTVAMSSSKNPAAPGDSYTVTATVAPSTPSDLPLDGTITFTIGTAQFGDPVPLDAGHSAAVTLTAPSSGLTRQTINALYSGNSNFLRSSGRLSQRFTLPSTTPPPAAPVPPLTCNIAPRATKLGRLIKRGATVDISCNHGARGKLVVSLSWTQARQLGFKATSAIVIARGARTQSGSAQFAIPATVPKKYRKRLAHAKRLPLAVKFAGWDDAGKTTAVTKRLTIRR